MKNNQKLFKRINALALLTMCFVVTGCQKEQPSQASNEGSGSSSQEETYNITRPEFDNDFENYDLSEKPSGINMTYYSDIYSRGFSWLTDTTVEDTELYLVKSDKGELADFSNATSYSGTCIEITYARDASFSSKDNVIPSASAYSSSGNKNDAEIKCHSHKVHVENLEKGKAYSYKIGSESGYAYGAFIVEKDNPKSVTAIQLSDAQTKDASKLNVWRNTFTKAVDTAGKELDTVLYNGDQYDKNMGKVHSGDSTTPGQILRYAKAYDVIHDYKESIPYMTSSGNHEPSAPYSQYIMSDIDYGDGYGRDGCYYSYNYEFAHFVVLNTNTVDDSQLNWLKDDLDGASNAKWKVVVLHIAPYSTGDHSVDNENYKIVEKLTPIFAEKHVDLVLQAHDHTYNKTLPYKWDQAGYIESSKSQTEIEEVINYDVETETKDNVTYDKNPNGTYYVTTGAAGHRCGDAESDGIYAEVVEENGEIKALNSSKTYLKAKYKIAVGKLTQSNQYKSYTFSGYTSDQDYQEGDPATGNVNAQMFGVLNLTESTLSYHVYTVNDDSVKLFDTLDVLKA